jgi:hypothetical protein
MNLNFRKCAGKLRWCTLLAFAWLGAASAEVIYPEDYVWWWPENIVGAARAFECSAHAARNARDSVMVWTDAKYNVVAIGSASEGGQIPAYAKVLARSGRETVAMQSVYVAALGHRVIPTPKTHVLKLQELKLSCIPSFEE